MGKIGYFSDNCAPVHPKVMDMINKTNVDHAPQPSYGDDSYSHKVLEDIEKMFGGNCKAHFVVNGTGANVTSLASLCPTWGAIICGDMAHIYTSESGATERATGAKMLAIPAKNNKLTPELIGKYLPYIGNYTKSQPSIISISQSTEFGTLYSYEEIKELSDFAHSHNMFLHMDGARFANAITSLNCSPSKITSEAGVDVLSFGMTKNGTMFGEAVVLFTDVPHFRNISKANSQIVSKSRYIAAQFDAMLTDDLWLDCAKASNSAAKRLSEGLSKIPSISLEYPVEANAVFAILPKEILADLHNDVYFMDWNVNTGSTRFMCSYDITSEDVDSLLEKIRELCAITA